MEKLPMCRICLAGNVRMYVVVNKNLRELYEKLTDNPFVTEDSRPMLACFFCCAKLKQCYQFQRKCLEAEELFAQMMNEDYELNPLLKQDHPEFSNGFIQTPIMHISIVDECQTENIAIKEELPADCERLDDIIEPKEEHENYELEQKNQENNFSNVDIPAQPLMELKFEVEEFEVKEHEVSWNKRRASDMQWARVATKPNLEDAITEEQQKNEQSDTKFMRTTENCTFETVTTLKEPVTDATRGHHQHFSLDTNCRKKTEIEVVKSYKVIDSDAINKRRTLSGKEKPYKCDVCQSSFKRKGHLTNHILTHTGEKPFKCDVCQSSFNQKSSLTSHIRTHTGEKPFKCDICQSSFNRKNSLTIHIRKHTGEKTYRCEICPSSFNQNSGLRRHILTHTGEKPFKCGVCQSSFTQNVSLIRHIRTHTGIKPYKCDVCQQCFRDNSNLRRHIRTHTGENP